MFYKSLKTEIIHKSFDGRVVIFHVIKITNPSIYQGYKRKTTDFDYGL